MYYKGENCTQRGTWFEKSWTLSNFGFDLVVSSDPTTGRLWSNRCGFVLWLFHTVRLEGMCSVTCRGDHWGKKESSSDT